MISTSVSSCSTFALFSMSVFSSSTSFLLVSPVAEVSNAWFLEIKKQNYCYLIFILNAVYRDCIIRYLFCSRFLVIRFIFSVLMIKFLFLFMIFGLLFFTFSFGRCLFQCFIFAFLIILTI